MGYSSKAMSGISWYQVVHPEDAKTVAKKHEDG